MTNNTVRVLHIVDKYGIGGVQKVVEGLVDHLGSTQVRVRFYFLRDLGMRGQRASQTVEIGHYSKYSPLPIFKLYGLVQREKIQILHTHQRKGLYLALLLRILRPDLELVHQEHGDILLGFRGYILAMKLGWQRIARFIAVSDHVRTYILENVRADPGKIVVLNNFIAPPGPEKGTFSPELSREKLGIGPEEFVIGFVGRLRKVKGCEYLIKALPYLEPPYRLLVFGDGDERPALERLARDLDVTRQVRFMGWIEDASRVYPLLDVLVLPSLSEASPIVLLEARHAGVPVVCSRIPALCSVVEDRETGLLFEPRNERDLAAKIDCIRRDSALRERIIRRSFDSAQSSSVSAYCRTLEEIYRDIASPRLAR